MTDAEAATDAPRVLVADDDEGVRGALAALFAARRLPCETFPSAEALLERLADRPRGCVLLDHRMPKTTGMEALGAVRALPDPPPVIMITAHGDVRLAVKAMQAGAFDFIEKPWETRVLFDTVDRALDADAQKARAEDARADARERFAQLTPREREVMQELITGAANKVVARTLGLSPRTVEFHRARVFEKTGVQSVAELVRLAFEAEITA